MANASRSAGGLSKGGAVQAASCERKYNIEPVDCGAKLKGSDAAVAAHLCITPIHCLLKMMTE